MINQHAMMPRIIGPRIGTGDSSIYDRIAAEGDELINQGILDTTFLGRVVETTTTQGRPAAIPEIEGTAHLTGHNALVTQPDDELPTGFLLTVAEPVEPNHG